MTPPAPTGPRGRPPTPALAKGRTDEAAALPAPDAEYTIDELARVSGVPSRTIRFYQSAGALPKPQIRGRVAIYGAAHVERLQLVGQLQDRGLRMKAIRELLGKVEKGELDLAEWLGLEAQLATSWANDAPRLVDALELDELVGRRRPGHIEELLRLKLVSRTRDGYLVQSPGLLQVALRLEGAGVDLETAIGSARIIRKHAARAAKTLAAYFFERVRKGLGPQATGVDLETAFGAMRPMSQETMRLVFGQEMERVLRELVGSGKATALPKQNRKRSRA